MDILEALKQVTTSIKEWADNNKVAKVSGKGLSTNDYTTADKKKVSSMPNDLMVFDGKLYLAQDGVPIVDSAVTLPSGGGGGGTGSGSSATITLKNLLDSTTLTVAVDGEANLKFSFASSEDDSGGTAYIYVGDVLKGTAKIISGENTIDISSYIGGGTNEVKITCMDIYSNSKSLSYTVNAISLRITSTFDDSQIYSGDINVRYIPYGAVQKTIYFVIDGHATTASVSETGKQQTQILPAMSHGVHTLRLYASAIVNGVEIKSNELLFDILCVEEGVTIPLISSAYNIKSVTQGDLINIPFSVYDPVNMTAEVTLTIKQGSGVYLSTTRTVDRTRQTWSTRNYPAGEVTFTITYGSVSKSHVLTVIESEIDVSVKETDLEFQLKSAGRSNEDVDKDVWTDGNITTTFEHFNWESTGWIEDKYGDTTLRLSGDAKAIINFQPFASDARQTGRTIEMEFAIRDVNNREAIAISCLSGGIGFTVTADTAKMMSEQSEIMCNYTDEEKIRVAFVIEPRTEYRLMSVYLNGVLSGAKQYPENDNLQQQTPMNITIGSPYCSVDLYTIRSYNTALTTEEVRDNYIADITDIGEKAALCADNDIYDAFGSLSFSALKDKIPVLVITGTLPTYKGDKKKVSVSYTDPFNPSLDFEDNATIDVQGTSSQYYNRKNWKIKTSEPHILDLDQVPTNVLCWKVDYAEATGSHNTANANYVHTLYGDVKTPPQEEDERVRTTIYGRPCVIFHKADSGSKPVFYGKSNSNIDKGGEEVFGFTEDYPDVQCVEFRNNVSDACLFHGPIPDSWGDDFEFRYPDEHDDISAFKIMHDWVVSTWQDGATGNTLSEAYTGADGTSYTSDTAEYRLAKFKKEFTEYFNLDFMLIYYVYTFVMLMVDQRAKNMFLTSWDKKHWQAWLYDNDTCLGINNEGKLVFSPFLEDDDQLDGANVYNGATSTLWVNFRESFPDEIQELYASWRSEGLLTYDKIIEYFITRQTDRWSISVYNEDADFKYVSMLREDNDATYLYQIRGTGEEHLKYFVKSRLDYTDSKWCCGSYPSDYISLRIYTPMDENNNPITDLPVKANPDITITPYSSTYAGVQFGAGSVISQYKAEMNTPITLPWTMDGHPNDLETSVFPASEISSLGDLSPLYCGTVNVSKATKLTELIVGSGVEGYENNNLTELSVGSNNLLQKIDVRNCPNLTEPLALANCPNIQEIYATGSSITGLELPSSGYLKKVYLPGTLANLTITNQQYIEEFELEGYDSLTTLRVEKAVGIPVEDIMINAPLLNRIRLIDVQWEAESEEALRQTIEKFKSCLGLDAAGNNTNNAVVTGRVKIGTPISDELYNDIYENFSDLIVDDGSDEIYIINYLDRNGESLYLIRLAEGDDAFDPIKKGYIERPADVKTEDYKYEFIGWSILPTNVNRHYIVTAQYSVQYAIKFYNGDELIYTQWSDAGQAAKDPVAEGVIEAPIKEGTDDLHYVFSNWDNLPTNVQNAVSVYAEFSNVYPVRFYSDSDLATLVYTQWVVNGKNATDPLASGELQDKPTKDGTEDMHYVFTEWNKIPTNVTAITQVYALYTPAWAVRFYNDNIVFEEQWILNGSSATIPEGIPTRTSTAQYDYTFSKWDGDYQNVTEARNVVAVYTNTIRRYNVYFYNGETLVQTIENVQYGSSVNYSGSTPVKTGVDNPEEYEFKGWVPEPTNITGETKCYALFKFTGYIKDDWVTIAANVANGTAMELYQIGGRKEISITLSDGTEISADIEIIAYNHDDLADGSGKATLTFFCKDLPNLTKSMNKDATNEGGWEASEMRTFVNGELFDGMPEELKNIIKPVYKISDGGLNNKTLITTTDKLWLASYDEVGLANSSSSLSGQGTIYSSIFTNNNNSRIKYVLDSVDKGRWWLRSSCYSNTEDRRFWRIQLTGSPYGDGAYGLFYVAFGFCI